VHRFRLHKAAYIYSAKVIILIRALSRHWFLFEQTVIYIYERCMCYRSITQGQYDAQDVSFSRRDVWRWTILDIVSDPISIQSQALFNTLLEIEHFYFTARRLANQAVATLFCGTICIFVPRHIHPMVQYKAERNPLPPRGFMVRLCCMSPYHTPLSNAGALALFRLR
jgi:hypothetical protein